MRLSSAQWRLTAMLFLTTMFFVVEIVVGYITNSMALVADSFHMFSDVIALIIAYISVKMSPKKWSKNTFGWARAEVLGALVNAVFLCALCFSIMIESIKRFLKPEEVHDPVLILVVGSLGLFINLIGLLLFKDSHAHHHHHHHHSLSRPALFETNRNDHHKSSQELFREGKDEVEMSQPSSGDIHQGSMGDINHKIGSINDNRSKPQHEVNMLDCNESKNDSVNNNNSSDPDNCVNSGRSLREGSAYQSVETNEPAHQHVKSHKDTHSSNSMNMRGVFLHVMADALGSVIVMISAITYIYTNWSFRLYVDPALSVIMVCLIMRSTWPLLTESAMILLQTVPTHIKVDSLQRRLTEEIQGVLAVHEFHVWQLAGDRIIASAHIRCHNLQDYMRIAEKVKEFFHNEGIHSTTIQPEFLSFDSDTVFESENCVLDCPSTQRTRCASQTCCGVQKFSDSSTNTFMIACGENGLDYRS